MSDDKKITSSSSQPIRSSAIPIPSKGDQQITPTFFKTNSRLPPLASPGKAHTIRPRTPPVTSLKSRANLLPQDPDKLAAIKQAKKEARDDIKEARQAAREEILAIEEDFSLEAKDQTLLIDNVKHRLEKELDAIDHKLSTKLEEIENSSPFSESLSNAIEWASKKLSGIWDRMVDSFSELKLSFKEFKANFDPKKKDPKTLQIYEQAINTASIAKVKQIKEETAEKLAKKEENKLMAELLNEPFDESAHEISQRLLQINRDLKINKVWEENRAAILKNRMS